MAKKKQAKALSWTTARRRVSDLVPADWNPRQMTESQVAKLTRSIERFDLVEIPAVNADGTILAGHQRVAVLALMGRGGEEIDVRVPSRRLTLREAQAYNVTSNKVSGDWDWDKLFAMPDGILAESGWDDKEIEALLNPKPKNTSAEVGAGELGGNGSASGSMPSICPSCGYDLKKNGKDDGLDD